MLDEAAAQREKADADIETARADLGVAEADRDAMAASVSYAAVRTFDGVVLQRNVHTGHFAIPPANDKAEPLLVVARTDIMRHRHPDPAKGIDPGGRRHERHHSLSGD